MIKFLILIMITLATACGLLPNAKTSVDMNTSWLNEEDPVKLFEQWMSTIPSAKKQPIEFGSSYFIHIPYDSDKRRSRSYMDEEYRSSKYVFYSMCSKLNGKRISVIQTGKYDFMQYDPASEKIVKRHYHACITGNDEIIALKRSVDRKKGGLNIALYTEYDKRKYRTKMALIKNKENADRAERRKIQKAEVKKANIKISKKRAILERDFRRNLAVGDTSHIGMIIEVKKTIAKVQTETNQRWVKIDELSPSNLPSYVR